MQRARAWDQEQKHFVYGEFEGFAVFTFFMLPSAGNRGFDAAVSRGCPVDFMAGTDRNGAEIFERDVITAAGMGPFEVTWRWQTFVGVDAEARTFPVSAFAPTAYERIGDVWTEPGRRILVDNGIGSIPRRK